MTEIDLGAHRFRAPLSRTAAVRDEQGRDEQGW
jgi:hypothetical protein